MATKPGAGPAPVVATAISVSGRLHPVAGGSGRALVWQGGLTGSVTIRDTGTIPPGGSQSFGFQDTWTRGNTNPTGFALDGSPCLTG